MSDVEWVQAVAKENCGDWLTDGKSYEVREYKDDPTCFWIRVSDTGKEAILYKNRFHAISNPAEAVALLESLGYTVEAPKKPEPRTKTIYIYESVLNSNGWVSDKFYTEHELIDQIEWVEKVS